MLFVISRTGKGLVTKASALTGEQGLLLHPNFSKHGQQGFLGRLPGLISAQLQGEKIKQKRFWGCKVKQKVCKALV